VGRIDDIAGTDLLAEGVSILSLGGPDCLCAGRLVLGCVTAFYAVAAVAVLEGREALAVKLEALGFFAIADDLTGERRSEVTNTRK